MASPKLSESGLPSMAEVIERIGFGWGQLKVALVGGCVWLADGSELLLIGSVTRAVAQEWNLQAWQRGSVVSVVFVGILLGNSLCGPFGDQHGRRLPIVVSYFGIAFFSILSACTQSYLQLAAVRLFVGAAFGIGQPAISALCTEVTPAKYRILMTALMQGMFAVGELYSASLVWFDDPMMKHLDWRWLLLMGALPSVVFFGLSYFFLEQSPSYLSINGDYDGAKAVLESLRDSNGQGDVSVEFHKLPPKAQSTPVQAIAENFWIIFSRKLWYSTITLVYSTFVLNFFYYGSLYAFPQVVTEVSINSTPAISLILGCLWEYPGMVLATILGSYYARKPVLIGYLIASIFALVSFALSADASVEGRALWWHHILLQAGYIGIKSFSLVGFICAYQYATEIYPTVARTTGTSACVAGGRLGGMVAPLVFEWLTELTSDVGAFFHLVAVLCMINVVLVVFLPIETAGMSLEDHHEDVDESTPLIPHESKEKEIMA